MRPLRRTLSAALPLATALAMTVACSSKGASTGAATDAGAEDMSATRPAATPVSPTLVGTGGFGFGAGSAFAGASAPQGLVKVGPDTSGPWGTVDFLHCSGYWFGDDTVLGFSHLHLEGTGVPDEGVIALMPATTFDPSKTTSDAYAAKLDKTTESAAPGAYAVTLVEPTGDRVRVELTATTRAAHHRYTFPATTGDAHVIVDLGHHLEGGRVAEPTIAIDDASGTMRGSVRNLGKLSAGFGGTVFYFALKTQPAWKKATALAGGSSAVIDYDLSASHAPIEIQIGLSLTSTDAARANLDGEMPSFDFDGERAKTAGDWNDATSVVSFSGGSDAEKTMLAAALYHAFLMPSIESDASGDYVGIDKKPAHADGFSYVTDMSLWDTYRTLHPLWDLVAPARARDAVRSLTAMAKASGAFPKWPTGTGEAGTMIGASAEVVVADAYLKGVTDFDAEGAYRILRAAAMDATDPPGGRGGRDAVVPYMKLGYVPASSSVSASKTIEYAQDDFALANLAAALGHADDAAALSARAHGWKSLYDAQTGFLWSKNDDGSWATTHGDATIASEDFDEANAWQSVWGPWFDAGTLATLMGGNVALVAKLESFFEQGKADYDAVQWSAPLSAGTRRAYYWGGNEPDIHAPYLFALAGRPDLTQKWVRWIENEVYGAGADGLPGNDDGGTMSAWLVFSALGLYPIAGSDVYVIGAPRFEHAQIKLPGGAFTIDASGISDAQPYIASATLNDAPLASPMIRHADIKAGGSLTFTTSATPTRWGRP